MVNKNLGVAARKILLFYHLDSLHDLAAYSGNNA